MGDVGLNPRKNTFDQSQKYLYQSVGSIADSVKLPVTNVGRLRLSLLRLTRWLDFDILLVRIFADKVISV